jgi:pilus assembly protein Flp/PilA
MRLRQIFGDQCAATAIEYGLIAALIAVAGITVLKFTGDRILSTFTEVGNTL